MWSHSRTRAFTAAVVAAALVSAGCLNPHLNPFPTYPQYPYPYPPYPPQYPPQANADKSPTPPVDNRTADPVTRVQHQASTAPPADSTPLPMPNPVPPAQPGAVTPPGQQPATVPQTPPQTPLPPAGGAAPNPHRMPRPSVVGSGLELGPNEMPLDRAVEILRRLDELIDENKKLQARIKTLEANGLLREQSMKEAMREVEKATEEVVKARTDIQGLRAEVTSLRAKIKQVEDNEIDTLKKVIEALEKVLEEK